MNASVHDLPLPILQGNRLRLRPPQESDKADRFACGRDAEFRKMVGGDPRACPPLTEADVQEWYDRVCAEPLHWIIEAEGRCIGTARLHDLEQEHKALYETPQTD